MLAMPRCRYTVAPQLFCHDAAVSHIILASLYTLHHSAQVCTQLYHRCDTVLSK